MKKSDLKHGNVVELRNGDRLLFSWGLKKDKLIDLKGRGYTTLGYHDEDLKYSNGFKSLDIMKVYEDYTCKELLWERKEKPKPTEDEKVILRNLPKEYKWIARDKCGTICAFIHKPHKNGLGWSGNFFDALVLFEHLFQFIQWEDEEPYLIEELLGKEK